MDKLTIRDFDPAGKRVLVRVDFNVPVEDGKVKDDTRVRAALPTIRYLLARGAAVILMSHLGRPNGKVVESARLRPVAQHLSALLRMPVPVTGDALGIGTRDAVARLKPGQVLMLENLRFHAAEEANNHEYAAALASYGEVYVNDAFGSAHRAHASTVGVAKLLPAYAGLLMEAEIRALSVLLESAPRPFAAVIGGAKVSTKLAVLENLLSRVDALLIGGGMANTFLVAQGLTVGKSLLERELVPDAQKILELAQRRKVQLLLPSDVVVAKEVTRGAEHKVVSTNRIPNSWSVVDIGPASTQAFVEALEPAGTVLWNGPLGVFEVPTFGDGTRAMARYLARRAEGGATVVVGGGDSAAAVEELGLTAKMTHVSTGGGASLEFLEGRELPGVAVLLDRPKPTPAAPPPAKPQARAPAQPARKAGKPAAKKPAARKPLAKPTARTGVATKPPTRKPAATPAVKPRAAPARSRAGARKPARAAAKPAARPGARKLVARPATARKSAKVVAKPSPRAAGRAAAGPAKRLTASGGAWSAAAARRRAQVPAKRPTKVPAKRPTKTPVKRTSNTPAKRPTKAPSARATKAPLKGATKAPAKGTSKASTSRAATAAGRTARPAGGSPKKRTA
jgi:phosphoglycerate kinase